MVGNGKEVEKLLALHDGLFKDLYRLVNGSRDDLVATRIEIEGRGENCNAAFGNCLSRIRGNIALIKGITEKLEEELNLSQQS